MDIFSTRFMLPLLEQIYPPKIFLLDTFFKGTEQSETEYVDIDIQKGKRRMAPFSQPSSEPTMVERQGYITKSFKPPYIKMEKICKVEDILKRPIGQTIYASLASPADRASQLLAVDLADLQEMVTRREEWMAAQVLETGKIAFKGEGVDAEIDFNMDSTHLVTLTGSDLWTADGSDPLGDLQTWYDRVGEHSGLNPDVVILGKTVAKTLLNHADVQKLLDNRRVEMGQIKPETLPSGAVFLGSLLDPAVDLYRYNEYYYDVATSTNKPMVPVDKLFMGSTQARTARHYGLIKDVEAGQAAVRFFPKSIIDQRRGIRSLIVQSSPVVCMHQVDAFLCAKAV